MLSSTIGGYLAGRLRTKWTGLHSEEVLFRDTAHGFLAWATATVVGAAALASAATFIAGGATAGAAQGASQAAAQATGGPNAYFVDLLLRPQSGAAAPTSAQSSDAATTRAEALRILARGLREGGEIPANDRGYLAQMVASRAGRISYSISSARQPASAAASVSATTAATRWPTKRTTLSRM
jgi:hypothetical protein